MTFKKSLLTLALTVPLLFSGCEPFFHQKNSVTPTQKYKLENISKENIGQGYNRPNGLSSKKNFNPRSIGIINSREGTVYNPITFFTVDPTYSSYVDSFITPPQIYGIDELNSVNLLYTFPEEDRNEFKLLGLLYFDEFGNEFIRHRGVNLETLTLPDNSILLISNVSKKMFRIYQDVSGVFQKETYFENDKLLGTAGMILEEDGNTVDLVQVPFYFSPTSENELSSARTKRIISFKLDDLTKEIQVKAELPDISQGNFAMVPDNVPTYSGASFQFGDNLGIVKNISGVFYVSDALDKKIYQIDNGVVSLFKELDRPPTSIATNLQGDLFVVKGTLLNQDKTPAFNSELFIISPDGTEGSMYSFAQNFDYNNEGVIGEQVSIEGVDYIFPKQDFSSLNLSETDTEVKINHADYLGGAINVITATKVPIVLLTE